MGNHVAVREGYVTVRLGSRNALKLEGLTILGYSENGKEIVRHVQISRKAPAWFSRLCYDQANTGFQIKVRINATYLGYLAYAVPIAKTKEEALDDWETRRLELAASEPAADMPSPQDSIERRRSVSEETLEYMKRAHETKAKQSNLIILEHNLEGERVKSTAIDQITGEKYFVTGGFIIGKLKEKIERGELDWLKQIDLFVHARLIN